MKISDLFAETYFALLANKARSGLTILGIVIGIASVIAMVAIGQGSQNAIASNIESLGSNMIIVMPGMQRSVGSQIGQGRGSAQTLTLGDADAIRSELTLAKAVAPSVSGRYQIKAKSTNTNTSVVGTNNEYLSVNSVSLDQGSFISDQQIKSLSRVAVLGPSVAEDLFGEDANPVGQTIRIKNMDFKIIGITKAKGGTGFGSQDDMIFIPISTAQQYLSGSDKVGTISVQAVNQESMTDLQTQITSLLLSRHKISDASLADFSTINQADIVSAASSVTKTFTMLLAAVAAISLVVGGIGIMNMMLTTVTERTREIGLRKAVGAKRAEISRQFLAEAIMLTLIGGILGVFLGWIAALIVQKFANIAASVSPSSVLLAFGVSAVIGIVFGYYPASRAAKMNPITALRYE